MKDNHLKPIFGRRVFRNSGLNQKGFTSAQFILLMGFTIMVFATFVNVLLVENMRATTLTALREGARAGTKTYDLRRVYGTARQSDAEADCRTALGTAMTQLNPSLSFPSATCTVVHDTTAGNDRYYMRASLNGASGAKLVPWASVFSGRLENLSATYTPAEAAK